MAEIDLLVEGEDWDEQALGLIVDRAVGGALEHLAIEEAEVSVLAADDDRVAELNAEFRGKPSPTNVLSWPAFALGPPKPGTRPELPDPGPAPLFLGDIALAHGVCRREAEAQGKPFEAHLAHLLVHGTLHLLGYDHENEADAEHMEGLETEILGILGYPSPY